MTTATRATRRTPPPATLGTRATSRLAALPVSVTGLIAAAAGAAALYAYGALARALSVPMRAGELGASHAQAITPASFASGVVFCTVAGTILAMILAARAADPARAFVRTTVILVAVSLVFPLAASHTATTTRLTLVLGHLIAAAIVIPLLTLRLTQSRQHRNPAR